MIGSESTSATCSIMSSDEHETVKMDNIISKKLFILITLLFIPQASCDVTFSKGVGIIGAFGDFDSDKLTDVFVISPQFNSFHIMKQHEHEPYLRRDGKSCSVNRHFQKLVSIIPGDFHGNTYMDVIAVTRDTRKDDTKYDIRLIRGNTSALSCSRMNTPKPLFSSRVQPLMLDFNGDMISDLMGEDYETGKRTVWYGSMSSRHARSEDTLKINSTFGSNDTQKMSDRSNSFVDLNCDQVADLFISGKDQMEYWYADPVKASYGQDNSYPSVLIEYPVGYETIGQSSFLDVDGDDHHQIEHVIPVTDSNGISSILMLDTRITTCGASGVTQTVNSSSWIEIASNFSYNHGNGTSRLSFVSTSVTTKELIPFKYDFPITLRTGDFNGDGYPDLVTIMRDSETQRSHMIILENYKSSSTPNGRSFRVYSNQPTSITDPIIGTFFDFKENNNVNLDIIYSNDRILNESDPSNKTIEIGVRENKEEFDAYFIKILVASGRCPDDRCYKEGWVGQQYRVNYGTNQPGPFISYTLSDENGNDKKSCGGQLTSSSHFSLQTPYTIFGLGQFSNYVDKIRVTIPIENNTSERRQMEKAEIVPGAQIIVIPHPRDDPNTWICRLFLYPSDIIFQTLYTLLGICLGLLLIILALHKKEQLDDAAEAEKYRQIYLGFK